MHEVHVRNYLAVVAEAFEILRAAVIVRTIV